jgi:FtsH-binding integral membrane protein
MYGSGASLLSFFSSVARQLPEIAVVVVGLVVVLGRKPGHPKASNLAATGLAVFLLSGLAGAAFYALAPRFAGSPGGVAAVFAVVGVVFSVLRACGLGLLVAAVVADRGAR